MSIVSRIIPIATFAATALIAGHASAQIQFQFQSALLPGPNEYTNQMTIVDIDGDGDLDLVFANGGGFSTQGVALKLRVYINNGAGTFVDQTDARTGGWAGWARGVEAGDADNDGDWDLVVAQDFNKQPQLFINDGNGFFTNETATRLPALTLSSARAQFGDVDNDGDLDLIFSHSGPTNRFGTGAPKLYINDGNGFYTDATAARLPTTTTTDQQDIIFGDIDGDFDLDFHLGSRASASKLYINNGSGVYAIHTQSPAFPAGGSSYSYDFGDINGDGDLDLVSAQGSAEVLIQNNAPSTVWNNISGQISPNTGFDDNDSKFFDYDNDGDLDLVVGSLSANQERIYRNNGAGSFAQQAIITVLTDSTLDIGVADVTGDGKIDIITAQGESGVFQNKIYVNIGGESVIDNRAPRIIRTEQIPSGQESTGPFVVRARIYDDYTSDRGFFDRGVVLRYSLNGGKEQEVPMRWSGNSMYRGVIPQLAGGGTLAYYVVAIDWNNNVGQGSPITTDIVVPCVGDIVSDGVVNVDDLLALLAAWGTSDPASDIAPSGPPQGDGIVNVDDLLVLLAAWGDC